MTHFTPADAVSPLIKHHIPLLPQLQMELRDLNPPSWNGIMTFQVRVFFKIHIGEFIDYSLVWDFEFTVS